jgi:APA family basic amino acid/polyamine antiporter
MVLYLPGSPSALVWPHEWMIFLGGAVTGAVFYVWARSVRGRANSE